ncbi:MAG: hypothetical protein KAR79_00130 [Simkaniaceae bacterium]|nr:hypothetical protein [Simkaniaceae bacterium]
MHKKKSSDLLKQGEKKRMNLNLKKLLPLTGIVCGCLMSFVHADDTNTQNTRSTNDNSHMNEITPNAGPRVSNGADVFITADFIWWNLRQDGMAYALTNYGNGNNNTSPGGGTGTTGSVGRGSVRHVADDWSPGFKVGLGLNLGHDGWDVAAEYTWLQVSNSSGSTPKSKSCDPCGDPCGDPCSPCNGRIFPMWDIAPTCEPVLTCFTDCNDDCNSASSNIRSASAKWKVHFNVIDIELARNHYISQYLTLRPHFGFKGAWIDQDYKVKYFVDRSTESLVNQTTYIMRNNQDYWGFGIRTGLDTAWYFMKNFCLYGDFALSALWSKFDIDRRDSNGNSTPDDCGKCSRINILNTNNSFYTIKPVLELELGLRYDWWFSDDDYHFGLSAGWEEQIWINHNNLLHLYDETAHGDLVTQGLTLKARFDF